MIHVTCPHCQASFGARDERAGRQGKCPKCQGVLQVPGGPAAGVARAAAMEKAPAGLAERDGARPTRPAASTPAPPADPRRAILEAFQGGLEPVRVSLSYRLGIVLVALVMVLLPLLYVVLIGLAGWGIYLHVIHDTFLLHIGHGRVGAMAVLAYLAPIGAGVILLLFMVKPLFARPARRATQRSLSRQNEPLLFAFVERVCTIVGAPVPKRIDVDCEVNASASLRHG